MIALRPIIAILAILVGPAVALYVLFAGVEPPGPAELLVAGLFIVISVALARRAVIDPLRALAFWRRFARERGHEFLGSLSREPVVRGKHEGRRFVAGLSTFLAHGDLDERYRTIISVPIEVGVPAGFRVYGRDDATWVHEESGKREISTGDREVEGALVCEGHDAPAVREFVLEPAHREALLALHEIYPELLVHGADADELPAEPGGASGVVTVALYGRIADAVELERHIARIAECAGVLDD